ncbi:MAG: DUF4738 domain-containing protein [Alloprevotella sp.]|nr:DUF4738 domain-containing protein [Alloprevotella sp.]MBR1652506.1 DUF4738 domain-containing protein [Alloprevotella sp.]
MKQYIILLAAGVAMLASCKEKSAEQPQDTPFDNVAAAPTGTEHSASPMQYADTMRLSEHTFVVSLRRYEDSSLPTVRDEMGTDFYDNRVEINIRKDGQEVFLRTFSKEDFVEKAAEEDRRMGVLLGMSINREKSTANAICLGAQVGQPGLEGEGSIFSVTISPESKNVSIQRLPSSDFQENAVPQEEEGD